MNYKDKLTDPRWQNRSGIYCLIINNEKYIGSATNLRKRLMLHISSLKNNRHHNAHLQRAYNKYMEIDFDILEVIEDKNDLIPKEQHYIDLLRPHYNIAPTAGSQFGFRHSEKTKRLISQLQIGKTISEETRKKMSSARKGITLSLEHRKKVSLAKMGEKNPFYRAGTRHPQYGIAKSETTRNRISETSRMRGVHKGSNNTAARSGVVYDIQTGLNYIFQSLKPLCEKLELPYKSIHWALRHERFYRGRYFASYADIPKHIYTKFENIN